jgi:hypothetical protein
VEEQHYLVIHTIQDLLETVDMEIQILMSPLVLLLLDHILVHQYL